MPNPDIERIAERIEDECFIEEGGPWNRYHVFKFKQCERILTEELAILKSERDAAVSKVAIIHDAMAKYRCMVRSNGPRDLQFQYGETVDAILASHDPAAQELLRDRERLEFVIKLSPPAFSDLFSNRFSNQMREAIDAAIAAGADNE